MIRTLPAVKFYFLDYFYILLKSVEKYSDRERVFDSFKSLKHEHGLGESKYKLLTVEDDDLSPRKQQRFLYTFGQVIDESKNYQLVSEFDSGLVLTELGEKLLLEYQENITAFNQSLCQLMEKHHNVFRRLIELMYNVSRKVQGLIVLPTYSPRRLEFSREEIKTTRDIARYSEVLAQRLQNDIYNFVGVQKDFTEESNEILRRLIESKFLPGNYDDKFDPSKYNSIIHRFRNFWNSYLLRNIYHYEPTFSSFERWTHRGKQIGVIHRTENYPDSNFNGLMVYPTSIIYEKSNSRDFRSLYTYDDGKHLLIHEPSWDNENNLENFVKHLVKAYFELRRPNQSYFIDLITLREIVCYSMKISSYVFDNFLTKAYKLNLSDSLQVGISLEVDKTPEEMKAAYLKREPVTVEGRYRNIIAIDVTKGGKFDESR